MFGRHLAELAEAGDEGIPEPVTANEKDYRARLERMLAPDLLAFAKALAGVTDEAERDRLANAASRFLAWVMSEQVKEGERNGAGHLSSKLMAIDQAQDEAERLRHVGIRPN